MYPLEKLKKMNIEDLPPEFFRACAVTAACGSTSKDPGVRRMFCRMHTQFRNQFLGHKPGPMRPDPRPRQQGTLQWD